MKKEIGYDKRPRFGWTDDLDVDPTVVFENKGKQKFYPVEPHMPVVIIPLPNLSRQTKALVRKLIGQRGDKQLGKLWK